MFEIIGPCTPSFLDQVNEQGIITGAFSQRLKIDDRRSPKGMFDQIGFATFAGARIILGRYRPNESPVGVEEFGYSGKTRVRINESPIPALAHFDGFVDVFVAENRPVVSLFVRRTILAMFVQCSVTPLLERQRRYFFQRFTPNLRRHR